MPPPPSIPEAPSPAAATGPGSPGNATPPETAPPLTDAYRPIRRVAPPSSPVAGVLAALGERRVVLADAADSEGRVFLDPAILGRDAQPQHLLAPHDLVRRADGHDLELTWCREPAVRLLDLRLAQRRPMSGGELVTLAVSVLRGTAEGWWGAPAASDGPHGRWWMDDDGRPVFAPAEDGGPVESESRALLGLAASHTRDRVLLRVIEESRDALERPRGLSRALPGLEDALFEACAPRPIERMSARALGDDGPRDAFAGEEDGPERALRRGAVVSALERFADIGIASAVADAVDRTRAVLRRAGRERRRLPLVVGGAAAGLVIVGGLLWPSGPPEAEAVRVVEATTSASPRPTTTAAPATGQPPQSPAPRSPAREPSPPHEDAEAAGLRLLAAVSSCATHGDPLCAAVRDGGAESLPDEVLDAAAAAREVTLVDDYGDVAVVRTDGGAGAPAVLLELVRIEERWLLRAAHALTSG
jgi:hypothetical protein